MFRTLGVAALIASAVIFQPGAARAGDPPAAGAGASAEAARSGAARGVVVVAAGPDAAAPSRALALLVYRDAGMRPSIDDATARVLAGEAVPQTASAAEGARLQELAGLRATLSSDASAGAAPGAGAAGAPATGATTPAGAAIPGAAAPGAPATGATTPGGTTPGAAGGAPAGAPAAPGAAGAAPTEASPAGPSASATPGGDAVERRVLAGIGAETRSTHIIVVRVREGRASARLLRVSTAAWEAVEISAIADAGPSGTTHTWPGALEVLRAVVAPRAQATTSTRPKAGATGAASKVAAKPGADAAKSSSFWSSPWFWAVLGGVVAAGTTTFVVAREAGSSESVTQVQGTVPR